ncbi:MAG: hypothetical protein Q8J62_03400 [Candidatus Cloacimonadaceae bacterium]|nr:hypothetical protein [Candidatus Cloacimonadaceae bacterium]
MSKQKYIVIQELDPESVNEIEETHKNNYLSLGFKPYLMANGKIKWLTDSLRAKYGARTRSFFSLPRIFKHPTLPRRRKRRYRNRMLRFMLSNLGFPLILAGILAAVWFLLRHWYLLF